METMEEYLFNSALERHLSAAMHGIIRARDILIAAGLPIRSIDVENWTAFDKKDAYIKLWNGWNHYPGTGKPGPIHMTQEDVVGLLKRRMILQRKF